ncbi:hypothetical protein Ae201684P_016875 [Aphanomyces euteiches]|uniref:VPS9 domain-containing protein n=1 Tax=Aphanomyces euteiches TaxID=100861 RepID=A0A6G0XID1_9STRA|nr:hypothetical protein Ae201684_004480 [Aphanomyces euteiches]KAH9094265.1 hypothetical protein Ae201684P_016875 [Aphanomyces euteiches]
MLSLPWSRQRSLKEERPEASASRTSATSTLSKALLSTERRDELLQLARNKRASWVEGTSTSSSRKRRDSVRKHPPSHVMEMMKCADDMLHFIDKMQLSPPHTKSTTKQKQDASISILEEIAARGEEKSEVPSLRMSQSFERAYSQLVDVLKHADAADLVHSIQGFIKSFQSSKRHGGGQGEKVHLFIAHFMHLMQLSPVVKKLERDRLVDDLRDSDLRREALEAFIMEKLHDAVFYSHTADDTRLKDRISALSFLSFEHLDITATSDEARWKRIQARLACLPRYLSPRRQMSCLLQVCEELTNLLKDYHGQYPGADDFLPALIYTLLKANPSHLHSTVAYIQTYRHPSKLVSEPGYFLTHLVSSLSFLEHLDDSALSITAEEFHRGLEDSKKSMAASNPSPPPPSSSSVRDSRSESADESTPTTSSSRRKKQQPPLSVLDVHNRRRKRLIPPVFSFDFASVLQSSSSTMQTFIDRSSDDIRIQEVPRLLAEYKMLNMLCAQHTILHPKNI